MVDRDTSRTLDAIPEADLAEQAALAYPDDPADPRVEPDDSEYEPRTAHRDEWDADPADVADQAVPVPFDDEDEDAQDDDSADDLVG
ncbi:hypothetical protein [Nocardia callitridis]|uniref:Uncharacterized protein n=1 Tax=Nocardia callitridis TaxID=648753 RepID=A0ABP9JXE8_9NOCA